MITPEELWKRYPNALAHIVSEEVEAARAEECEACAKIAEAWLDALAGLPDTSPGLVGDVAARIYRIGSKTATEIAAAIRARRVPPTEPEAAKEPRCTSM